MRQNKTNTVPRKYSITNNYNSKKQIGRFQPLRTYPIYLLLILFSNMINGQKIISLIPFQSSAVNTTPIAISHDNFPDSFLEKGIFTVSFELIITFYNGIQIDHDIPILSIESSGLEKRIKFLDNESFTLDNAGPIYNVPTNLRRTYPNGDYALIFHFQFQFTVNGDINLHFLNFTPSILPNKSYETEMITWDTQNYDATIPGIFKIKMDTHTDYFITIRNVYAVDKHFASSDYEFDDLHKGIAMLQQALYFYMEPANSKILYNRSKFNYPPAINGNWETSCANIASRFSKINKVTYWMLQSFEYEYMKWEVPSVNSVEFSTIAIVLNLELFLRNTTQEYINNAKGVRYTLARLYDKLGVSVINFKMKFLDVDLANSEVSMEFFFVDQTNFTLLTLPVTDTYSSDLRLSLNSIIISLTPLSSSTIEVELYLKSSNFQSSNHRIVGLLQNVKISDIALMTLGSPFNDAVVYHPALILSVVDLQIFHGGYFLSFNANHDDLSALSKNELVNMHCAASPRVSRPSGNATLEAIYNDLRTKYSDCTLRKFNDNCSVANCEICARTLCLVCEPMYTLSDASTCNSTALDIYSFDIFSRVNKEDYISPGTAETLSVSINSSASTSDTFIKTGYVSYDHGADTAITETVFIRIDSKYCTITNHLSLAENLLKEIFNNEATSVIPLELMEGSYNFYSVSQINLNLFWFSTGTICDDNYSLLKSTKYQYNCPSKIVDISTALYFPPVVSSIDPRPPKTYIYQFPNSNLSFILKCQNNCECSEASSVMSCDSSLPCSENQKEIVYKDSPRISECVDVMANCALSSFGLCLKCDELVSYSAGKVVLNGFESIYEDCQFCDVICVNGCSGPTSDDCIGITPPPTPPTPPVEPKICDPLCSKCENSNCVSCMSFPLNFIFKHNALTNEIENISFYYCQQCQESCKVCSDGKSCTCFESLSSPFLGFNSAFNICLRMKCPENCLSCDLTGKCLICSPRSFLVQNECLLRSKMTSNCSEMAGNICRKCSSGFVLNSESSCSKCSSCCAKCALSADKTSNICIECSSSILVSNQCVYPPQALKVESLQSQMNFLVHNQHDHISVPQPYSSSKNCSKRKNHLSNICLKCSSPYYLLSKRCLPCPVNSTFCKFLPRLKKLQVTKCALQFYYNPKTKKCVQCPPNCQTCSPKGCTKCFNKFELHKNKCIQCDDPNCKLCESNSVCLACASNFFLNQKTKRCDPCSLNCKVCSSESRCFMCLPLYFLKNHSCQKKCVSGLSYFDASLDRCLPCSACKFCVLEKPTACFSCDVCKRKCQLEFIRLSGTSVSLSSPDLVFPPVKDISISFKSESKSGSESKLDSESCPSMKLTNNTLVFDLPAPPKDIQAILRMTNFKMKQCNLPSALPLLLSSLDNSSFLDSDNAQIISSTIDISKTVGKTSLFLTAITSQSMNANSLILLFNLNLLFSYSYIISPPLSGFTFYLHELAIKENTESSLVGFTDINTALNFSLAINEFNIMALPIISFQLIMSVFVLLVFAYLSFCYMRLDDAQVKELFPLFVKRRMDKTYMKKFFKIYRKKISSRKMNQINQYFRRTKKNLKASKFIKVARRCLRSMYTKRYLLLFLLLQSICIEMSHLSAKCTKLFSFVTPSFKFMLITSFYYMLLGFYIFMSIFRLNFLQNLLPLYVINKKREYVEEYVLLCTHIPFTFFTMFYVYFIVLLSNKTSHLFLLFLLSISYFLSIVYEMIYMKYHLKSIVFRMICNFPILIIFHLSAINHKINDSLLFDLFFVYLNVSRIVLFVYEFFTKSFDTTVDTIISKNTP